MSFKMACKMAKCLHASMGCSVFHYSLICLARHSKILNLKSSDSQSVSVPNAIYRSWNTKRSSNTAIVSMFEISVMDRKDIKILCNSHDDLKKILSFHLWTVANENLPANFLPDAKHEESGKRIQWTPCTTRRKQPPNVENGKWMNERNKDEAAKHHNKRSEQSSQWAITMP